MKNELESAGYRDWLDGFYEFCKIGEEAFGRLFNEYCDTDRIEQKIDEMIFLLTGSLGDSVQAMALMDAVVNKHPNKKFVAVCMAIHCQITSSYNDIEQTKCIGTELRGALQRYVTLKNMYHTGNYMYAFIKSGFRYSGNGKEQFFFPDNGNYSDKLEAMLGVAIHSKRNPPRVIDQDTSINSFFKNSILIIPKSKSIVGIPMEFWYFLAEKIEQRGLEVWFNDGGKEPYSVRGKYGERYPLLSCGLRDLARISRSAKGVIGIRSGGIDWLANATEAKIVVLYPDPNNGRQFCDSRGVYAVNPYMDVKQLRNDPQSIWNMVYSDSSWEELVSEIMRRLEVGSHAMDGYRTSI